MEQLQQVFDSARQLYSLSDIEQALDKLAESMTENYAKKNPIILCVMNGSVVTTGHLLPRLSFPLELDYIHVTRYGDKIVGGELKWLHKPVIDLQDRHIILVEDIYDQGVTLHALRQYCHSMAAQSVTCVTLIDKLHDNKTGISPEFIGLTVPDCYVFGFGMDYQGYWRNAPGIFAAKENK